jgi:hypothetical protein
MAIKRLPVTKEPVNQFISDNYSDQGSFTPPYGFQAVSGTGTFVVPFGVTKIFAVLIGGGGSCGSIAVYATTVMSSQSRVEAGDDTPGGNTTLTIGSTTYTASGGLWGGLRVIRSGPNNFASEVEDDLGYQFFGGGASSSTGGPIYEEGLFVNVGGYPGSGGGAYHTATAISTSTGNYTYQEVARGRCAMGGSGQTTFHEINVTPGTQIAYSVGAAGNNAEPGAIYISY